MLWRHHFLFFPYSYLGYIHGGNILLKFHLRISNGVGMKVSRQMWRKIISESISWHCCYDNTIQTGSVKYIGSEKRTTVNICSIEKILNIFFYPFSIMIVPQRILNSCSNHTSWDNHPFVRISMGISNSYGYRWEELGPVSLNYTKYCR